MTIEVNYKGMNALRDAVHTNETYLASVHSFITSHNADFGAFTGFLSLFKDDYKSAYADAEEGVAKGRRSAHGMHAIIESNKKQYRTDDVEASDRLKGIDIKIDLRVLPDPQDPSSPLVSQLARNVDNATGTIPNLREGVLDNDDLPKRRGSGPGHIPIADLAGYTESTIGLLNATNDANDDSGDYTEFENEGKR